MDTVNIPILLGTARKGRKSERVARLLEEILSSQDGVKTQIVDVRELGYRETIPPWGDGGVSERETEWKRIMDKADGLWLVVPEYNRGYPGELKLALDSLGFEQYAGKPVAFCGVSSGAFGGSRVIVHMQQIVTYLKMVVVPDHLYVSHVDDAFDDSGILKDESLRKNAIKTAEKLRSYAVALKSINLE